MLVAVYRSSWEHDEEMMRLYEEMEQHISCEKARIEQEVQCISNSTSVNKWLIKSAVNGIGHTA